MKRHDKELAEILHNVEAYIKALEETNERLEQENEQLQKELIKVQSRGI